MFKKGEVSPGFRFCSKNGVYFTPFYSGKAYLPGLRRTGRKTDEKGELERGEVTLWNIPPDRVEHR